MVRSALGAVFCALRLGVLLKVPFYMLLKSFFLWVLTEKSTVSRPPRVEEGDPTALRGFALTVLSWLFLNNLR